MKLPALVSVAALAISLAGCNNEPEETPDLEEAIPLDNSADDTGAQGAGDGEQVASAIDVSDDAASPADGQSGSSSNATPTMERGSNADGARAPDPSRTKLIPAD